MKTPREYATAHLYPDPHSWELDQYREPIDALAETFARAIADAKREAYEECAKMADSMAKRSRIISNTLKTIDEFAAGQHEVQAMALAGAAGDIRALAERETGK